jgi:3-methylcrotonyl-CoA carboxylase alpha subunit
MPSIGRIKTWRTPRPGNDLRIDAGYRGGDDVSQYYDAMLAKVIAWAPTRESAIEKLGRALEEIDVRGIATNVSFLTALVTHPAVQANAIDTGFIERELQSLTAKPGAGELELCAAVAAIVNEEQKAAQKDTHSPWQTFGWMPVGRRRREFSLREGHGPEQRITLSYGGGPSTLSIGDRSYAFAISSSDDVGFDLSLNGVKSRVGVAVDGNDLYLRTRNGRFGLHWIDPFGGDAEERVSEDKIKAPLPGTVVALLAQEGAKVDKGAAIVIFEVMKMEQTLRAPYAGVVKKLKCRVGDVVGEGFELAEIEPAATS